MKRKHLIQAVSLAGSLSLALWCQQSAAQQIRIEEIVVTAQKRTENLQDVPLAVTALSANFIAENDIRTLEDMAGSVPGLVVTNATNAGQAPLSIRGLGAPSGGGSIFNDDPVGIYVDGMYIARSGIAVQDLVDLESIQVLRGPQGTLYGRNSTAGAVLLTTKRPTREFEGELRGGYARYDEYNTSLVLSGPLSETLSGRTALAYRNAEGYAENIVDGGDVGSNESSTARVSLQYEPNSDLTVNLIANYADLEANNATIARSAVVPLPGPFLTPVYGGNPFLEREDFQQAIEDNKVAYDAPNATELTSGDVVLLVNWDLGSVVLDSVTGFRKLDVDSAQDSDAQPDAATFSGSVDGLNLLYNENSQSADQYSQEFRLSSTGSGSWQWIAGVYYLHEDIDFDIAISATQGGPPVPLVPGPTIPPFTGFSGTSANFIAASEVDAYAVFFDTSYDLTDRLKLTVGGRYSYETKDADIDQSVTRLDNGGVLAAFELQDDDSFSDFSPRLVLDYALNDNVLLFASFNQGFKSGGYNSFDASPTASSYPAEEINAYEVGLKSDFWGDRVRVNASAFVYDYTNLQLRQAVFTGGVSIRTVDEAAIKGLELETTWAPTDRWRVRANLAYLDGELEKGELNALPSDIGVIQFSAQQFAPPAVFPTEDVSGNRTVRSPEWQFFLSGEYELLRTDTLSARASLTYRYQDEVYFSETNQDVDTYLGESWEEVDARLVLEIIDGKWELAVFGQNIFDERHVTQTAPFSGFPVSSVNEPAKWGVQGVWRF